MRKLSHPTVIFLTLISFASTDEEFETFPHGRNSRIAPVSSPVFSSSSSSSFHETGYHHEILEQQHESDDTSSSVAEARGAEGCSFPTKWEGSWFQSGVHQTIIIKRNIISSKGRCLETDYEKYHYIVYNERDKCYRCVVFTEKHFNVLQYKETFCVPERSSLKHICSTISGDANLFAMFRLDAVPIDCPFKGPFTFTYSRGQGDCVNPVSSAEPCIHSSRYLLNFQACPDVKGTESAAEELQCLATWKEGSSRYLLGLIQYHHPSSYEERFRCFVYEISKKIGISANTYGNLSDNALVKLSQSGDATCNGLSLYEGSRTMLFKRAPSSKPCQFPSWLQSHTQWHTLDQRSTFVFESNKLRVSNSSDLSGSSGSNSNSNSGGGPSSVTMIAVCSQIQENPTTDKVMLILHSTAGCRSGYICSIFYKRHGHIVELQLGNMVRRAEDACHIQNFNQSQLPYVTLVSSTPETRQCPNLGRFQVTGFLREGKRVPEKCDSSTASTTAIGFDTLSVGCYSLDTLQLRSECSNTDFSTEYACHGSWEEMGLSYLIATPLSRSSTGARRYCFVYRETTDLSPNRLRLKSIASTISSKSNNINAGNSIFNMEQQIEESAFGRILHFSSIADSCRRNIIPGVEGSIAFNVTANGQCNDISKATRSNVWDLFLIAAYQLGLVMVLNRIRVQLSS